MYGLKQAALLTVELTLQYERLNAKLLFTFTNQERVNKVITETRARANALGQNFITLTDQYASFAAAAKGTTLSSKEVENVFFGVAKAGAALQLSNEGLRGSLFAIQQMMSKGKVNSEEFRLQLAERLPIALLAATRATGLTTKQFTLMLESGKIISDQFLPKFAKELENLAEGSLKFATTSLPAELERAKNGLRDLALGLGGGATNGMKDLIKATATLLEQLRPLSSVLGSVASGVASFLSVFVNIGGTAIGIINLAAGSIKSFMGLLADLVSPGLAASVRSMMETIGEAFKDTASKLSKDGARIQDFFDKIASKQASRQFKQMGVDVKSFATEVENLSPIFEEVGKNADISEDVRQQISTLRKVYVENIERLASDIAAAYGIQFGSALGMVNDATKDGIINTNALTTSLSQLPGGSDLAKEGLERFNKELLKSEKSMYSLQGSVQDFAARGGLASALEASDGQENNTISALKKQGFALDEIQLLLTKAKSLSKQEGLGALAANSAKQNRAFLTAYTSSESFQLQEALKAIKKDGTDLNRVISDATRTIENALDSGKGKQSKGDRIRQKTQSQVNDIQNAIAILSANSKKLTQEQAEYLRNTGGLVDAILFNGNREADRADVEEFIDNMKKSKSAIENVQGAMAESQRKSVEAGNGIADAFEEGFDRAIDAMADFIVTGKFSFGNFLQDMAKMLAKSGLRTLFAQGLFPLLQSGFGNDSIVGKIFTSFGASVNHTGGRVGSPTARMVNVNPGLFANAPRFHKGLRPDEFPAILQKGETVIPRNQTGFRQGAGTNNVSVNINVDGNAAAAAGADPKATMALSKQIGFQVEEAVLQAIQKHSRPGGALYTGGGRF